MTRTLSAILVLCCLALGGCYYTVTDATGETKRISAKEYNEMKRNNLPH